jgi:hypothetical protein
MRQQNINPMNLESREVMHHQPSEPNEASQHQSHEPGDATQQQPMERKMALQHLQPYKPRD